MEISPAAKVGMIAVLAAIILALIYTSLNVNRTAREGVKYYVVFDRVEGLQLGSTVRLAGVNIGKVTNIDITENKQIKVEFTVTYMKDNAPLAISSTSQFGITSNLLGDKWLEITPRTGPQLAQGGTVMGTPPVTIDQLMAKGEEAMSELERSVQDFNKLVGDPEFKRNIQETVANFSALSGDMRVAANNINSVITNVNSRVSVITRHVDDLIVGLQGDMREIGSDFRQLSASFRRMTARNEPEVGVIVNNLRDMSASLKVTMASVQQLATNKQLQGDIVGTVTALRKAAEEVDSVARGIASVTNDPQVQANLKDTITDARETMAGAKQLVDRLNKAVGGFMGGSDSFKLFQFRGEGEYNTRSTHLYSNALLTLLPDYRYSGMIGVDSIGYQNLVNAQIATGKPSGRIRGGVVRSKFGVGFDTMLFSRLGVSADVYDPADVKIDVIGRMTLARDFYIMGGVRDVIDNRRYPVVGLGKRF